MRRDESGLAMVVVLLVTLVLVSLSLVVVQLASHSTTSSSYDQRRLQAVHAAETGINEYLTVLPTTYGPGLCADGLLDPGPISTSPLLEYTLDVELRDGGTTVGCAGYDGRTVDTAIITSTATAGTATANSTAVTRVLREEVTLTPIDGDEMNQVIYATNSVDISGNVDINGSATENDADIYVAGDFAVNNYANVEGSVYAKGNVSLGPACYAGSIYADGNVESNGGSYVNYICNGNTQKPGAVVWDNGYTYTVPADEGGIWARGNITLGNNAYSYGWCTSPGAISVNHCSGFNPTNTNGFPANCPNHLAPGPNQDLNACGINRTPPLVETLPFPSLTYSAADWTADGYAVHNYTTCAAGQSALVAYLTGVNPVPAYGGTPAWTAAEMTGKNVLRITSTPTTPVCAVTLSGISGTLPNDLAVIVDGSFETGDSGGGVQITNSGAETHTFYVIRPPNGTPAINPTPGWNPRTGDASTANCDVTASSATQNGSLAKKDQKYTSKTDMSTINFFSYTPCAIYAFNQNKSGSGQYIAGDTVFIKNSFTLNFNKSDVPGVVPIGYEAAPVYVQELRATP
ncbi:MAG: hypothetical protein WD004_07370 [Actinomycetota bacterium]